MTIIVFLVDTSASMQQKAFVSGRSSLLDVAKGAVEFFVKMRQKSPESRGDRYMLLTFEEFPKNIKAGWKENLQTFMTELKNLEAHGMTTMGSALKQVFDTLNINRMQTGIDMYGQGRYPFYLEPAVIIVISDGGKLTTQGSVQSGLNLPMHSTVPGSELTREPFRWDQRLYALVLRMAGTPPTVQETQGHVASDNSPIDAMCEVTGGRSYAVTSQRVLHQCIDSLVQKLQSGVVIHFEKFGPDPIPLEGSKTSTKDDDFEEGQLMKTDLSSLDEQEALNAKGLSFNKETGSNTSRPHTPNPILAPSNIAWHSCRRLIYVPRSAQKGFAVGFWPLPEAFWPDINSPSIPQRTAHPKVNFSCTNQEPLMIENLPFDKYELEPSPLTLYILARKQPKYCWLVHIQGSSKSAEPPGHPFGYLKASTNLLSVNLYVLPYNFTMLLPLLEELFKVHRLKPTTEWRNQFHMYLRTMPAYYAQPLRRALTRMGAGNLATSLVPESMDSCLSYSVLSYLKRLKNQAKVEYDKTLSSTPIVRARGGAEGLKVMPRSAFKRDLLLNHTLKEKFSSLKEQVLDFPGFTLGLKDIRGAKMNNSTSNYLRNPFDVPRKSLLDQLVRMRANYLQPLHHHSRLIDEDTSHSLPIGQMGNYQDYLKKMPVPLREIESTPVRQHMFGNPFKINKNMILDEVVDEMPAGVPAAQGPSVKSIKRQNIDTAPYGAPPMKRARKGPLPKDFVYRRSPSPAPHSPAPSPPPVPENVMMEPHSFSPIPVSPALPRPINVEPELSHNGAAFNGSNMDHISNHEASPAEEDARISVNGNHVSMFCSPSTESPNLDLSTLTRPESLQRSTPQDSLEPTEVMPDDLTTTSNQTPTYSTSRNSHLPISKDKNANNTNTQANRPLNGGMNALGLVNIVANGKQQPSSREASPVGSNSFTKYTFGLSWEEFRRVQTLNQNMRQMIYKEVKRPGRNHEALFKMLKNELHGPPALRRRYLDDVIAEALRFKRSTLADVLAQKAEELTNVASPMLYL